MQATWEKGKYGLMSVDLTMWRNWRSFYCVPWSLWCDQSVDESGAQTMTQTRQLTMHLQTRYVSNIFDWGSAIRHFEHIFPTGMYVPLYHVAWSHSQVLWKAWEWGYLLPGHICTFISSINLLTVGKIWSGTALQMAATHFDMLL